MHTIKTWTKNVEAFEKKKNDEAINIMQEKKTRERAREIERERERGKKREGISYDCFCIYGQPTFSFFSLALSLYRFLFVFLIIFQSCTAYYNVFLMEIKTNILKMNGSKKRHWKEHLLSFFFSFLSSTMSCINYITSFSPSLSLVLFLFTINLSILSTD